MRRGICSVPSRRLPSAWPLPEAPPASPPSRVCATPSTRGVARLPMTSTVASRLLLPRAGRSSASRRSPASARRTPAAPPTTPIAATTSTTIPAEPTTTTIASTTTTSTIAGCSCCTGTGRLAFTTGVGSGNCGAVVDDTGTNLLSLGCGGLYFGGAGVGVPPSVIPDGATSFTNLATCDAGTGAITLSATTATDTGSNRNCTAAGVTNPEYPGKPGCLFGPPLPIPNPNSPATSTCVVNRVTTSASGNGNCNDGSVALLNIPLGSDIYLTGPTDGVVPCPRCTG